MRSASGRCAWVALLASGAALAVDFEAPPAEPPAAILSAAQRAGENFEVEDPVRSDGLMHRYVVVSRYGTFDGYGRAGLEARLREVAALAELQKTNEAGVVVGAVGESVAGGVRALIGVATHPIATVSGVPRGVSQLFEGYAAQTKELGEQASSVAGRTPATTGKGAGVVLLSDARRYAARYFGVNASERRWFGRLGVDPYTDNEPLRRAVHRYARVDATTQLGLKFASLPCLPYAGTAQRAMDAIYSEHPAVLRARRRAVLSGYGLTPDEINAFDNALLLNPTHQQILETAAKRLAGVEGRAELFRHATTLVSEQEVEAFVRSAVLLAEVHGRAPLARIVAGLRLPAARSVAGGVVVASAFDAVSWTSDVDRYERAARQALGEDAAGAQLWLAEPPSARAADELRARGWRVQTLSAAAASE